MKKDNGDLSTELTEYRSQYEAGLYTLRELVWVVIDLMSESMTDENWRSLPEWLQTQVVGAMRKVSEKKTEKIIFGDVEPEIAIQRNKIVKAWLREKGYLI